MIASTIRGRFLISRGTEDIKLQNLTFQGEPKQEVLFLSKVFQTKVLTSSDRGDSKVKPYDRMSQITLTCFSLAPNQVFQKYHCKNLQDFQVSVSMCFLLYKSVVLHNYRMFIF